MGRHLLWNHVCIHRLGGGGLEAKWQNEAGCISYSEAANLGRKRDELGVTQEAAEGLWSWRKLCLCQP